MSPTSYQAAPPRVNRHRNLPRSAIRVKASARPPRPPVGWGRRTRTGTGFRRHGSCRTPRGRRLRSWLGRPRGGRRGGGGSRPRRGSTRGRRARPDGARRGGRGRRRNTHRPTGRSRAPRRSTFRRGSGRRAGGALSPKRIPRVACPFAEALLDAQELVVLGDAVGAAGAASLDLAHAGGDREVSDEGVLGLAGPVRDHRMVPRAPGGVDRLERFGKGTDLVHLDEDGIADAALDPLAEANGVGDEEVVADEQDVVADRIGERLPAVPVVLVESVLD